MGIIVAARLRSGESKKVVCKYYGVTIRTINLWLSVAYGTRWINETTVTTKGYSFPKHDDVCQLIGCNEKAEKPLKTGFKEGSTVGQWKYYCPDHGFVFYNLEK